MHGVDKAFPRVDPVGPAASGIVVPGFDVITDVVATGAERTDSDGVPRSTIDALASAGLLGTSLEPPAAQREVAELIAGTDASTWFCWTQHQTPMRILEGAVAGLVAGAPPDLRDRYLPGLRSGELLAAVAFAHVRRPGPPNPLATRIEGGWRLEGDLDWVTSWDIADVVMVMARERNSDLLVCCYLPAGRSGESVPGLMPGPTLDLLAMAGTHTRPVRLDGVVVHDAEVGAVLEREPWLAADVVRTSDANPASFGVTRGALAELSVLASARSDARLMELVEAMTQECRLLRDQAYSLADADASIDDRLRTRAQSLDLTLRATTAVVTARAGAAMRTGHSAERRAREALFLLVQAQTGATRAASIDLLLDHARSGRSARPGSGTSASA